MVNLGTPAGPAAAQGQGGLGEELSIAEPGGSRGESGVEGMGEGGEREGGGGEGMGGKGEGESESEMEGA